MAGRLHSTQTKADGGRYDALNRALPGRVDHDGGLVQEDESAVRLELPLPPENQALRFGVIDHVWEVDFLESSAVVLKKSGNCAAVSRCPRGIETNQQGHTHADQHINLRSQVWSPHAGATIHELSEAAKGGRWRWRETAFQEVSPSADGAPVSGYWKQ